MLHTLECPQCRMEYSIATEHVGARFQCPQCSCLFVTRIAMGGFIESSIELDGKVEETGSSTEYGEDDRVSVLGKEYDAIQGNADAFHGISNAPGYPNPASETPISWKDNPLASATMVLPGDSQGNEPRNSLFSAKDHAELSKLLELPGATMALRSADQQALNSFTIMEIKKILQYLREKYGLPMGLEVTGKKSILLDRLWEFLKSPMYERQSTTEELTALDEQKIAHSLMDVDENNLINVACPECQVEHQVDAATIMSNPGTHYECPDCGSLFSVSLPRPGEVLVERGLVDYANDYEVSPQARVNIEESCLQDHKTDSLADVSCKILVQHTATPIGDSSIEPDLATKIPLVAASGIDDRVALRALRLCAGSVSKAIICGLELQKHSRALTQRHLSLKGDQEVIRSRGLPKEDATRDTSRNLLTLFPQSQLLDATSGCLPLRQMAEVLSRPSLAEECGRLALWALIHTILQLEAQILHLFFDVGRMYIRKVAKRIEKSFEKQRKSQNGLHADEGMTGMLAVRAPVLQREIKQLEDIMNFASKNGVDIPPQLLEGYLSQIL